MLSKSWSVSTRRTLRTKSTSRLHRGPPMTPLTETSKSLAEKTEAKKEKEVQRDDAVEKLASARESLKLQTDVLMESIKELQDLKPACVDTGMSYKERVARREQEIQSLKQADCILVHFAEFGPDGAAEAC